MRDGSDASAGAEPLAGGATGWGKLVGFAPYQAFVALVCASPRRQFFLLAAFPAIWVLSQHLGPIVQMLYVSFTDAYPVTSGVEPRLTLENYRRFFDEAFYRVPFYRTLVFATTFTLATLVITYPVAYFLTRIVSRRNRLLMLLLLLIPFWVGEIVRTFAIMILLGNNGAVNLLLKWLGLIERPIPFMYTGFSISVGIIYLTALYMLLPLYSALEKLPRSYGEAAADLGAGPFTRFRRVTLPLTLEGIASGCILVFLISTGFYGTPVLLGGPSTTVFAETIAGFFHVAGDEWPTGAAFATIMFSTVLVLVLVFQRFMTSLRKGDTR
ncbi:MAG: ABC transporter permease [Thiotrichales bacterium]|nr:ABC transporter permease [Thiotrichales bacterium]